MIGGYKFDIKWKEKVRVFQKVIIYVVQKEKCKDNMKKERSLDEKILILLKNNNRRVFFFREGIIW